MIKFLVLVLLFINYTFSQTILSGKILDNKNNPLQGINAIAIPKNNAKSIKFSTTNKNGEYILTLDNTEIYEIKVLNLGYHEEKLTFEANSENKIHHFILQPKDNKIEERIRYCNIKYT